MSQRHITSAILSRFDYCLACDSLIVEEQNRGGIGGCPMSVLRTYGRVGYVCCPDELTGDAVDLFFVVPAFVRVKLDIEGCGQHLCGEFLGIVSGLIFGFAETVMLLQVAVGIFVSGDGVADRADP